VATSADGPFSHEKELLLMSISSVNSTSSQLLQSLFKSVDTDTSGGVSLKELESAASDSTRNNAVELFKSLDTDSDGVISQAELKSAIQKLSVGFQDQLLDLQATSSSMSASDLLALLSDSLGANTGSGADAASTASAPPAPAGGGKSAATTGDPADLNHDGVVTDAERLAYEGISGTTSNAATAMAATAAAASSVQSDGSTSAIKI
jgi:Ca2+-binding EF-hand superfamily protein